MYFKLYKYLFLISFLLFSFSCNTCSSGSELNYSQTPLLKEESIQKAIKMQEIMRTLVKQVKNSIVRVETEKTVQNQNPFSNDPLFRFFFNNPLNKEKEEKKTGLGSGFLYDFEGHVITNYHVIKNVDKITLKFVTGLEVEADVLNFDEISDIALLKIDKDLVKDIQPVFLGDSSKIEVGDHVIAIGNPYGLQNTLTTGVISSNSQEVQSDKVQDFTPKIQTDAAINPGNSGGPLLNYYGEVIGINQMIYTQSGGFAGVSFAIPINHAKKIIHQLKQGKKIEYPYLGISFSEVISESNKVNLNIPLETDGLLVVDLDPKGPAKKSGIRLYDYIIKAGSIKIDTLYTLNKIIRQKKIGSMIKLTVIRKKNIKTIYVRIAKKPTYIQ